MRYSARHLVLVTSLVVATPAFAGMPARDTTAEAVVADAALRAMRDTDAVRRVITDHAAEHRSGAAGWPCDQDRSGKVALAMLPQAQRLATQAPSGLSPRDKFCPDCAGLALGVLIAFATRTLPLAIVALISASVFALQGMADVVDGFAGLRTNYVRNWGRLHVGHKARRASLFKCAIGMALLLLAMTGLSIALV